jgi:hypothetical protein
MAEHEHEYITMTGTEFNEAYGKYEMIKILRRDLTHHGYVYIPNALNKMRRAKFVRREKFDSDPDCKPGGLYFCKAKHLFTFIDMGWTYRPWPYTFDGKPDPFAHSPRSSCMERPLIAIIKIPAKATVSIGRHKFKTNMMELGEPIELKTYITDEYILKRSRTKINRMYKKCLMMGMRKMADRVYELAGPKIAPQNMCFRFDYAARENDEFTLRQMLEHLSAKNVGRSNYPRELRKLITCCVERAAREAPSTALKCCYEEGIPFNLNNNRLLKMVLYCGSERTLKYMIGVGFDIDGVDGGPDIFVRKDEQARPIEIGPTLLEQMLENMLAKDKIYVNQAQMLIRLGAQISKVNKHVLIDAVSKLNESDRHLASLISEHVQQLNPEPRFGIKLLQLY